MPELTTEERLSKLESQVTQLVAALNPSKAGKYDWISTIGMFANDPVMKEIDEEALRFREEDRERCRKEFEADEAKAS